VNIARHLAKYEGKGFTADRARVNVLMEGAAIAIFRDFRKTLSSLVERHSCSTTKASPTTSIP
jgi:hypothetical protein